MNEQDLILIHKYLRKELNSDEERLFQDKLSFNQEFCQRLALEESVNDSLNEESWSFVKNPNSTEVKNYQRIFQSKEIQELKKTLQQILEEYNSTYRKKSWILYLTTAAVVTIISTLLLFPKEVSNKTLYSKYLNKNELIALVDRGKTDSILSTSQILFDKKNYTEVIDLLNQEIQTTNNINVYIYLVISQIELERFDEAEIVIDKLIISNLLDAEKGHWYKSLLYLKSDKIEETKRELNFIIQNNFYNKDKAKELLKELK